MVILSLLASSLALMLALFALMRPFLDLKRIRVSLQLFEDQFEELRAYCKSAVGRFYRERRSTLEGSPTLEAGGEEVTPNGFPGLSPTPARKQSEILARRRKL